MNDANDGAGNQRQYSNLRYLICTTLGYCCLYFFFKRYRRTALIEARLGCSIRAVRYRKAQVDSGKLACEKCAGCMKRLLTKEQSDVD